MDIQHKEYLKAKQRLSEKELTEDAYLKLSKEKKDLYQLSLKGDRDFINSVETAYEEAYQKAYNEAVALNISEKLLEMSVDIPNEPHSSKS
jgi:hypothetical protein